MARYVLMVLASPKDGEEDGWSSWHKDRHMADILDIDGIMSAERFRTAEVQQDGSGTKWKFATLYEIETDDPQQLFDELAARLGSDRMPLTPHSDPSKTVSQLWIPISQHRSP